jgi:aminoglycoside phosphotransferase (APT) family kinase protein
VWSDRSLARVAELVRELHDLTAGSDLAGSEEVVCHNDLASRNTVYRDPGNGSYLPVAFIDWDLAGPGSRIHDVACVCWQFVIGDPDRPDPVAAGKLLRLICDAYGLAERTDLLPTIMACQDRNWRQIEARANAGDKVSQGLKALGAVRTGKDAYSWTATHRHEIERALGLG